MKKDIFADVREITIRGILLGLVVTVIFTASNLYLALKVGLTIASSIPAAIISMALLRFFKGSNVLENNIVQTIASSAGSLTAIIFSLPAIVIIGYWSGFDFYYTAAICILGGIVGVMFSIPLRRTMVLGNELKFPEGVAAAEVLKVGSKHIREEDALPAEEQEIEKTALGARELLYGVGVGAVYELCQSGFNFFGSSVSYWLNFKGRIFGIGTGLSVALVGAGYLAGINVGIAFLVGTILTWCIAIPAMLQVDPTLAGQALIDAAKGFWATDVRYIGVGAMTVASVWTLIHISKSMVGGIRSALAQMKVLRGDARGKIERTDFDIPFHYIGFVCLVMLIPLFFIYKNMMIDGNVSFADPLFLKIALVSTAFTVIFGFLISVAAGYMAGLVGSSASPISGLSITCIFAFGLLIYWFVGKDNIFVEGTGNQEGIMALIIFVTSIVLAIAAIANDNLQDLKTGQLVGATPYKQQISLIIGVIMGGLVIPPILNLLFQAYGFVGVLPHENMDPSLALAVPQAVLATNLIKGIFLGDLNWKMLITGGIGACFLILLDYLICLKNSKYSIPVLGVGMGVYLPFEVNMALFLGGVLSWFVGRAIKRNQQALSTGEDKEKYKKLSEKKAVLLASGFIVGESLIGIVLAACIVLTGVQDPLNLMPASLASYATPLGAIVFFLIMFGLYKHAINSSK
jgi:putative OPT family oligopeptide transporter